MILALGPAVLPYHQFLFRRAGGQAIKRTVFFAKIIKIWSHVHHRAGCALYEIVRHELAAVPVKIVA